MRLTISLACLLLAGCSSPEIAERSRVTTEPLAAPEEREGLILSELNELRTNPAGYAARIGERLPFYEGNMLRLPGAQPVRTVEGPKAAMEAIAALKSAAPTGRLDYANGLSLAARIHVRDIGPKGLVSHEGGGATTPHERMARFASKIDYTGENITFGPDRPRDVILDLLIDDNTPGREHRRILLDPKYRYVGVACGNHALYRTMCVLDFAGEYDDKT